MIGGIRWPSFFRVLSCFSWTSSLRACQPASLGAISARNRGDSSVVERRFYTALVGGSNPSRRRRFTRCLSIDGCKWKQINALPVGSSALPGKLLRVIFPFIFHSRTARLAPRRGLCRGSRIGARRTPALAFQHGPVAGHGSRRGTFADSRIGDAGGLNDRGVPVGNLPALFGGGRACKTGTIKFSTGPFLRQ